MKNNRIKRGLAATLAAGAGAAFFLTAIPVWSNEAEWVIEFGTMAPEGSPWAIPLNAIKQRVERDSQGRVEMKLRLGGSVGGGDEVAMVRDVLIGGRLNGGGFTTAAIATGAELPQLQICELPFLFNSYAEADHIMDNVLWEPLSTMMADQGLIATAWAENGWRDFAASRPIQNAESFDGLNMRSMESQIHTRMYQTLGASSEAIPMADVPDGLQRGRVTGFDNTPLIAQAYGWTHTGWTWTVSNHIYQPAAIVYSRDMFEAMPSQLQDLLRAERQSTTEGARQEVRSQMSEALDLFRLEGGSDPFEMEVYEMTAAERQAMAEKLQPVHDQMASVVGADLLATVRSALAEYRASN